MIDSEVLEKAYFLASKGRHSGSPNTVTNFSATFAQKSKRDGQGELLRSTIQANPIWFPTQVNMRQRYNDLASINNNNGHLLKTIDYTQIQRRRWVRFRAECHHPIQPGKAKLAINNLTYHASALDIIL